MPFTPDQLKQLAAANEAAHQAGQLTQVLGPHMLASLNPPDTDQRILAGVPFKEIPLADPMPWMPCGTDIAWGLNDRVLTFTNQAINVEVPQQIGFDLPSVTYALTAAVRTTDGNAIPGTFGNVLDTFRIQFVWSGSNRRWQTIAALGSTVLGSGSWPRLLGRPGWRFTKGSNLIVNFTPLVANLQVDIVLWVVETSGPGNLSPALL